ncbi:MAG: LysE family transporter [Dehalococcoidia bacterium]|nr:LysE family transporter [Dehalococcoidia bacterium]
MPEATILVIFTTAFLIGFSGAMMPGPLLAYTISASAKSGFWVGPLIIVGHAILELSLILAVVLGLDQFIQGDTFAAVVGLIGGGVLILMGFGMARQGWKKVPLPLETSTGVVQNRKVILAGIVISMSNPYWFLWWATIGLAYLLWSLGLGAAGVASFFTGHILADLTWYAAVALIVATGRRTIINQTVYSGLLMVCGVALVGLGGYFFESGIAFLAG